MGNVLGGIVLLAAIVAGLWYLIRVTGDRYDR